MQVKSTLATSQARDAARKKKIAPAGGALASSTRRISQVKQA
jgi:hypothetical protein